MISIFSIFLFKKKIDRLVFVYPYENLNSFILKQTAHLSINNYTILVRPAFCYYHNKMEQEFDLISNTASIIIFFRNIFTKMSLLEMQNMNINSGCGLNFGLIISHFVNMASPDFMSQDCTDQVYFINYI